MSQVPASLVREQWPTILGMAGGGAWSLVPHRLRSVIDRADAVHTARVDAGSDRLLDAYARWAGAPPERYAGLVPPHAFSRFGMPMVARLTSKVPHSLLKVVNQGVRLQVAGPLERGRLIDLTGRLVSCTEDDGRVRIHTRVQARQGGRDALTVDTYAAVVVGARRGDRRADGPAPAEHRTVGTWSAGADAGVEFFRLTGDFNPIHTSRPFAERTRFRGCILHGFGNLARTWEALRNAGLHPTDLDVRFVAPNHLPSPDLEVQIAELGSGRSSLRLLRDGEAVMVGTLAT